MNMKGVEVTQQNVVVAPIARSSSVYERNLAWAKKMAEKKKELQKQEEGEPEKPPQQSKNTTTTRGLQSKNKTLKLDMSRLSQANQFSDVHSFHPLSERIGRPNAFDYSQNEEIETTNTTTTIPLTARRSGIFQQDKSVPLSARRRNSIDKLTDFVDAALMSLDPNEGEKEPTSLKLQQLYKRHSTVLDQLEMKKREHQFIDDNEDNHNNNNYNNNFEYYDQSQSQSQSQSLSESQEEEEEETIIRNKQQKQQSKYNGHHHNNNNSNHDNLNESLLRGLYQSPRSRILQQQDLSQQIQQPQIQQQQSINTNNNINNNINNINGKVSVSFTKAVLVFFADGNHQSILGEVIIDANTTVEQLREMIAWELEVEGDFQLLKCKIPITKKQNHYSALNFFRNDSDFAVIKR